MAKNPPRKQKDFSRSDLEEQFLSHFSGDERSEAREILDLGKASYKMRDDDNIFLGRIEAQLESAMQQARQRLKARGLPGESVAWEEAVKALKDPGYIPIASPKADKKPPRVLARQIVGQPAGPGVGTGRARVVKAAQDLFDFKSEEVLVCDSLDPTMTFVVPLASAIVERRGGMLVHGSIIAREYEIPCVTGVLGATEQIRTGDWLTVDGTLGIVTIERRG
jgi:pyruvate,water dikinase